MCLAGPDAGLGWCLFTGGTGTVIVSPPARTGNRTRRSGGASCCHSQTRAAGRAADHALAVSAAFSLTKGTCSIRSMAAVNMVAGR
jgi:hypothetical protein